MGQYQFLRKISTHFPYFHLLTPHLKWSNEDFYKFHLPLFITTSSLPTQPPFNQSHLLLDSTNPFLLQPPPCPPNPLLINHIFSWKIKIKLFLEASYGTSQTSKLEIFRKNVNGLKPKTISATNSTLEVWDGPK